MKMINAQILFKGETGPDLTKDLSCGRTFKIKDTKRISLIKDPDRFGVINGFQAGLF